MDKYVGRKGSKAKVVWAAGDRKAFEELKAKLCECLQLWQLDVDQPFRMQCDASDAAIGAVLLQLKDGVWRPVSFFSRKLARSQKNWTPREKETYAIVAALRKWGGYIGYQPVVVSTDHKSLENWVTEHIDTPSGPRGRRARWHETLSQFDLSVEYLPGPENLVADAMSRFAYPASSSREDVSFHGSREAKAEMDDIIRKEMEDERMVRWSERTRIGP